MTRGFEILTVNEVPGIMPTRGTPGSAGYDFYVVEDIVIEPKEIVVLPTHITAYMKEDEWLDLRVRSSMGKRGLVMLNGCGVVDSDYYGKDIGFIIQNVRDVDITLNKGERIGQGIFSKYHTADNDIVMNSNRTGGFGSTNN